MKANRNEAQKLIQPITSTFGAIVYLMANDLTPSLAKSIRSLLYQHKVLIFPGQHLKPHDFKRVGRMFGELIPFVDKEYHHPDYPEIFVVSNAKKDGKRFGMDRVGHYWHSDSSFLNTPQPITMLYAEEVPAVGGKTGFIDMVAVLASLPKETRLSLSTQHAVHEGQWRYIISEKDVGLSVEELLTRDRLEVPPVIHPMVIRHPATRAESLYINEGFTKKILGIPPHESEQQLKELFSLIAQSPNRYEHTWQRGDLVLWDNRSVVHRAFPATSGNRILFRLGIKDGPFYNTGGGQ